MSREDIEPENEGQGSERDEGQSQDSELLQPAGEVAQRPPSPGADSLTGPAGQADQAAADTADAERLLRARTAESEDYLRRLRRALAENQNLLKRIDRMRREAERNAVRNVARQVLPLGDSLALAREASQETDGAERLREGLHMIEKELYAIIAALGIEPMEALGKAFDPHYHEAVMRQVVPGAEPNTVVMVLKRGFLMGDDVIRPAQVAVAAVSDQVEQAEQ